MHTSSNLGIVLEIILIVPAGISDAVFVVVCVAMLLQWVLRSVYCSVCYSVCLDYFLWSNKSNIQRCSACCRVCGMGWLRLVGSLKLYVSFAEIRLFYRVFLQKRPIILKSLLIVANLFLERYCLYLPV